MNTKTTYIKFLQEIIATIDEMTTHVPNNSVRTALIEAVWKLQDAQEGYRKSMGPFAPQGK